MEIYGDIWGGSTMKGGPWMGGSFLLSPTPLEIHHPLRAYGGTTLSGRSDG
jgi:hypothetical protein